jgi:hypothetical protein
VTGVSPADLDGIDLPLLTKVLNHVTIHPDEWDQNYWARQGVFCGTTACLGGTTVLMAGYDIDWTPGAGAACDGMGGLISSQTCDAQFIPTLARELLGLDHDQAERLFHYYGRDVGELWRRAAEITGGRVAVPPEYL